MVSIGVLFFCEGGYYSEKDLRQNFYKKIEEMNFSVADKQKIEEEREKISLEIYGEDFSEPDREAMMKKGKYADTKIDDYKLLGELLTCIDVVEKRNGNTELLAEEMEGQTGNYEKEDNQMLVDRKKLTASVSNMLFGGVPCLLLIFILSSSFAMEYESNVNPVLRITKKGGQIYISKLLTGIIIAIVTNLFFWGIYYICQFFLLGMTPQDWRQPLFLVEDCQMCASGMSIQSLLVKQIFASMLVSVLIAMLTMLLSKAIKKSIFASLVTFAIFVITLLPDLLNTVFYSSTYVTKMNDWYLMSEPEFYRMLQIEKTFNPISLLQFRYYVEQPIYTQISNYQYPTEIFPILAAVFLIGIFGMVLSWKKGR